ncbi:MAG TPA: hypothetical protein DCP97_00500, partial [Ruminococcaceae bacterium]|nr:hypothetical protein [Oscillospiraceae bacterium]
ITQNPTKYDPLKHPENNKIRREWFLSEMHKQGKLTKEEYDTAMAESANMKFTGDLKKIINPEIQSYFVENCIEEVINDLVTELGYTKDYAKSLIYRGGYKIYTTIDQEMQTYLEQKYADPKTFPKINNPEYPHSSFVIMDTNGKLLALVGDRGEKTGNMLYNYATHIQRQPGSTIKPISSYALAIENDYLNFSSMVEDSPIKLKDPSTGVEKDWPVNVYGQYLGKITVDEALQRSTNTIPVKLVEMLTPSKVFDFVKASYGFMGLIDPNDRDLSSMSLGGMTKGVSTLELTAAYQIFANGGLYTKPYSYTKVLDAENKVVLEKSTVPKRIISSETATVMNRLLQNVVEGRIYGKSNAKLSNTPMGGKTGTSSNDYDHWFIGFTPYYVAGVWLGYDTNISINYKPNPYPAMVLWRNIMSGIHSKLPTKDFQYNQNVVAAEYCIETGELAGPNCTKKSMGYYKPSFIPPVCTLHSGTAQSADGENHNSQNPVSSSSSSVSTSSSSSVTSQQSSSSQSSSSKSSSSKNNNGR